MSASLALVSWVLPIGINQCQELLRIGVDVLMQQHVALLIDDADVHSFGVQIDATIMLMCLGVESH